MVVVPSLLSEGATWLQGRFTLDRDLLRNQSLEITFANAFVDAFVILIPWAVLVVASALIAPAALGGFSVSFKTIMPKEVPQAAKVRRVTDCFQPWLTMSYKNSTAISSIGTRTRGVARAENRFERTRLIGLIIASTVHSLR